MYNTMVGVRSFLSVWDQPRGRPRRLPIRHSALGHRNVQGVANAPAMIFTRWHPQFEESLERGVSEMVLRLIDRLECITYSSCEGHPSADGTLLLSERNVDVLPRGAGELRRLRHELSSLIGRVQCSPDAASLRLIEGRLDTEAGPLSCLDLRFLSMGHTPGAYFTAVEEIYADLLARLATV